MEDRSLIPVKENFLYKIKKFFNNWLKRSDEINKEELNSIITMQNEPEDSFIKDSLVIAENSIDDTGFFSRLKKKGYKFEKQEFVQDIDVEQSKQQFFELYENLKLGKVKIEDISAVDLIRLNMLLKNM